MDDVDVDFFFPLLPFFFVFLFSFDLGVLVFFCFFLCVYGGGGRCQVLRDHTGLYVTFNNPGSARRAQRVVSIQHKPLAYQSVSLTVHPAVKSIPKTGHHGSTTTGTTTTLSSTTATTTATTTMATTALSQSNPEQWIEQARIRIGRELRMGLEKDVLEKVVGPELLRLVVEMKRKNMEARASAGGGVKAGFLKGLSFKKQRQVVDLPEMVVVGSEREVKGECEVEKREEEEAEEEEEEEEEEVVAERPPKKKQRITSRQRRPSIVVKRSKKIVEDEEIESEEEDPGDMIKLAEMTGDVVHHYHHHHHHRHKRSMSREVEEGEQPLRKKLKLDKGLKSNKGAKRRPRKVMMMVMEEEQVQIPVTPSESRSPSPAPRKQTKRSKPRVVTPPPTPPPPDPMKSGLCEDDEDLYYSKLVLSGHKPSPSPSPSSPSSSSLPEEEEEEEEGGEEDDILTSSLLVTPPEQESLYTPRHAKFRSHDTGSARTEGYYKITHAEKAEYVAQYQQTTRTTNASSTPVVEDFPSRQRQGQISSSRSNRATARRRAQGLEEMKELQHAILLSKGEMASAHDLMFKFNQLQTRKKHLRFAKSPIHDWGLYAMERVSRGEMVIEYVGEVIRAAVADKREKAYERQGIGSSYLFRIDEDLVVDATKKGNLG